MYGDFEVLVFLAPPCIADEGDYFLFVEGFALWGYYGECWCEGFCKCL